MCGSLEIRTPYDQSVQIPQNEFLRMGKEDESKDYENSKELVEQSKVNKCTWDPLTAIVITPG